MTSNELLELLNSTDIQGVQELVDDRGFYTKDYEELERRPVYWELGCRTMEWVLRVGGNIYRCTYETDDEEFFRIREDDWHLANIVEITETKYEPLK